MTGEYVPRDPDAGFDLIGKAASKNFGPAVYELAVLYSTGDHVQLDKAKSLQLKKDALMMRVSPAQFDLGLTYEAGTGVEANPERARYYFRLCAASGAAVRHYHPGSLMATDDIQALAWLQLASVTLPEAAAKATELAARMTDDQRKTEEKLKAQLLLRPE